MALSERFIQSRDMSAAADSYYDNLSSNISHTSQDLWEQEITQAEANRLQDAKVMDIMAARTGQQLPVNDDADDSVGSQLEEAIKLALDIEEQQ